MDARGIALIVFVCVFGSAMFGFFLGKVVSDRHLDGDSKDIVKLSTGLIATLSALVLGLLVSSAKGTFERVNNELMQMSVKTVLLDRLIRSRRCRCKRRSPISVVRLFLNLRHTSGGYHMRDSLGP